MDKIALAVALLRDAGWKIDETARMWYHEPPYEHIGRIPQRELKALALVLHHKGYGFRCN